jgi:uncharacterized protein (DUF2384 family)
MGCGLPVLRLRRDKLLHVAKRVLGSEEAARAWVKAPNAALGGAVPEELVETLEGLQQALAELESTLSR